MSSKFVNFISSFGMMLLGVALLFFGSVKFAPANVAAAINFSSLPVSGPRMNENIAGNIAVLPVSRPRVPILKSAAVYEKPLTAQAAIVIDDKTNKVLFKINSDELRPVASISKLMSAIVLSTLPIQWSSTTVVTSDDVDASSHQINVGEKYSLEDLWNIALIGSSNSAINAIVRSSGFTRAEFAELMNRKAKTYSLNSFHFNEPTGLNSGNVGNALDVARLLKEALTNDKISNALKIGEYYAQPLNKNSKSRRVWTTNWLLSDWVPSKFGEENIIGKTGYITDSGYNFAVRLTNDEGRALRVVVLGSQSNELRFSEARDLAEWAFANYIWPDQPGYDELAE